MHWQAACAAVVPCLNEEATIGSVVQAVRHFLPNVFVIDDGSSDATARAAEEAGAVVLKHNRVLGKGRALHTGWSHVRARGFDWALNLDGDGQHCPADIPALVGCAEASPVSLVVGNRMHNPGEMPVIRRLVNRWMSRQISALCGHQIPDSQCGFRLMNLHDWARLQVEAEHFEIESDVIVAFARAGLGIGFVPVRVIYKREHSKIHPLRDTVRWLRWRRTARAGING
ncbi:MAG TPA: glycosyltransferase family 2 protein [Verrucomicrobiae bacterium]|nr:glycosyltransferase family 2 protein [Verrucomicrobiae bacterium]